MSASSIYHFFAELVRKRGYFLLLDKDLEDFEFPKEMISVHSKARFPDLILKENASESPRGGELIEIKGSKTYSISSFNSTIPTGYKRVKELQQNMVNQLESSPNFSGLDRFRPVYYLIRGMNLRAQPAPLSKVCLVHGAFFESIPVSMLIGEAFTQLLDELGFNDPALNADNIDLDQSTIARTRQIEGASVKLRFRVMSEVAPQANLLNGNIYPEIEDNSISLILPLNSEAKFQGTEKGNLLDNAKFNSVPDVEVLVKAFSDMAPDDISHINLSVLENRVSSAPFLHAWASFRFDKQFQVSTALK